MAEWTSALKDFRRATDRLATQLSSVASAAAQIRSSCTKINQSLHRLERNTERSVTSSPSVISSTSPPTVLPVTPIVLYRHSHQPEISPTVCSVPSPVPQIIVPASPSSSTSSSYSAPTFVNSSAISNLPSVVVPTTEVLRASIIEPLPTLTRIEKPDPHVSPDFQFKEQTITTSRQKLPPPLLLKLRPQTPYHSSTDRLPSLSVTSASFSTSTAPSDFQIARPQTVTNRPNYFTPLKKLKPIDLDGEDEGGQILVPLTEADSNEDEFPTPSSSTTLTFGILPQTAQLQPCLSPTLTDVQMVISVPYRSATEFSAITSRTHRSNTSRTLPQLSEHINLVPFPVKRTDSTGCSYFYCLMPSKQFVHTRPSPLSSTVRTEPPKEMTNCRETLLWPLVSFSDTTKQVEDNLDVNRPHYLRTMIICGRVLSKENIFMFISTKEGRLVPSETGPLQRTTLLLPSTPEAAKCLIGAAFGRQSLVEQRIGKQTAALQALGNIAGENRSQHAILNGDAEENLCYLIYEDGEKCGSLADFGGPDLGAIGVLKEVVRLASNLPDPYHTLGLVYNAFVDKKTELSMGDMLASLYMENNMHVEALQHIENAKRCGRELPLFLTVKAGICQAYHDDMGKAENCFSPLQREGEDHINLITAVAKSFISLQHSESTLKCYLLLEENFPDRVDNGVIHLKRAHCYSALNNGVAAGINMPARAAIIASLSKRTDGGRVQLRTNEMLQMAGRAVHRGIDERGHVVFVQTPTEGPEECCKLLFSGIEPLVSQFTDSYGMVLNLLAGAKVTSRSNKADGFKVSRTRRTLEDARKLVEQSFGNYLGNNVMLALKEELDRIQKEVEILTSEVSEEAVDKKSRKLLSESAYKEIAELQEELRAEKQLRTELRRRMEIERMSSLKPLLENLRNEILPFLCLHYKDTDGVEHLVPAIYLEDVDSLDDSKLKTIVDTDDCFLLNVPEVEDDTDSSGQLPDFKPTYHVALGSNNSWYLFTEKWITKVYKTGFPNVDLNEGYDLPENSMRMLLDKEEMNWEKAADSELGGLWYVEGSLQTWSWSLNVPLLSNLSEEDVALQTSAAYFDVVECYKQQRNKVSRLKKRIARSVGFKEYKKIVDMAKFNEEKIRHLKSRGNRLINRIEQIEPSGWKELLQITNVIHDTRALDTKTNVIFPLGETASAIRGENELWLAMVLRNKVLIDLKPAQLAAVCGSLVSEGIKVRPWKNNSYIYEPSTAVTNVIDFLEEQRNYLLQLQEKHGVAIPCCLDSQFSGMVEAWASGLTWREIMMDCAMDEGDLARLLRRTIDILAQIPKLPDIDPVLQSSALTASSVMDRPPISELAG